METHYLVLGWMIGFKFKAKRFSFSVGGVNQPAKLLCLCFSRPFGACGCFLLLHRSVVNAPTQIVIASKACVHRHGKHAFTYVDAHAHTHTHTFKCNHIGVKVHSSCMRSCELACWWLSLGRTRHDQL